MPWITMAGCVRHLARPAAFALVAPPLPLLLWGCLRTHRGLLPPAAVRPPPKFALRGRPCVASPPAAVLVGATAEWRRWRGLRWRRSTRSAGLLLLVVSQL